MWRDERFSIVLPASLVFKRLEFSLVQALSSVPDPVANDEQTRTVN